MTEVAPSPDVLVGGVRGGYGHDRAFLAIFDALNTYRVNAHDVTIGVYDPERHGNRFLATYWNFLNKGLGLAYNRFPRLFLKATALGGAGGMRTMNTIGNVLDHGDFDRGPAKNTQVVVGTHALIADISHKKPTFLLALDPCASMYDPKDPSVTVFTPDLITGRDLKVTAKDRPVVVTGPFIATPVVKARERFGDRREELVHGANLRITIATGGSGSHPEEIIALTRAYAEAFLKEEPIEDVTVVAGASDDIKNGVEKLLNDQKNLHYKIHLIYN